MVQKFHAFMFPWFAFGHMIPYLHLANKLAEKGHRTLTIPPVDGLPAGAETSSDIPISLGKFLSAAMDLTRDQVAAAVRALTPDLILFDFAYWVPEMAKEHRVKSVLYNVISATTIAHNHVPGSELGAPPPGYPSANVLYRAQDAHALSSLSIFYKRLYHRMTTGLMNCDIISMRTCEEVEGKFCDYIALQYRRKVLLTGPMLPELDKSQPLEDQWSSWLTGFRQGAVVFCALGSQITLEENQFQELCLGMELTGLPFLVAERVNGRGVVWAEWVQQPLILAHPSVGCFVSHCGFGSMWESLMNDCQIVLLPFLSDQILNTRLMTEELEISVEVPREETRWFSKESLSAAIISVMNADSDLGSLVRRNHTTLKEILVSPGLSTGYTDKFMEALQDLVNDTNLE
ncbi:hypothetical protein N665_0191s0016 [Sinapis alba]|nr:hypothetical protein N665_0191s0016 [Sinapis alba]